MPTPIERSAMYRDHKTGLVVVVDRVWVDSDGEPQVTVAQYSDTPPRAHNTVAHMDEYDASRSLHANDIHEREETGELEYIGVA